VGKELRIIIRIKVHCAYAGREVIRTDGGTALIMPNVNSRWGVIALFHPPTALLSRQIPTVPIALEDRLVT